MKTTEKITALIVVAEKNLSKLKADLKLSVKAEAEAKQRLVLDMLQEAGLSVADVTAFIQSRKSQSRGDE